MKNVLEISFTEAKAYGCFVKLMERMEPNFPHGTAMDSHLANIQAIIQVSSSFLRSFDSLPIFVVSVCFL